MRHPSLWPLCILPIILTVVLVAAGLLAGWRVGEPLASWLIEERGPAAAVLGRLWTWGAVATTMMAGMLLGLGLALLSAAPILEALSQRVESLWRGHVIREESSWSRELRDAFRGAAYFLARAPLIFLVGLMPLIGPPIAALWGAHSLAFQQTEGPLARRGLDFAERRRWHRRHRAESLGFGLAGLVALLVPLANLVILPTLVVGGTLLACEGVRYDPVSAPVAVD